MNRLPLERWEEAVQQAVRALPYPPTPDVAGKVASRLATRSVLPPARRRLAWALVLLLALVVALLAVPPVRAVILEFLQIGAVRIWLVEDGPTPAPRAEKEGSSTPGPSPQGERWEGRSPAPSRPVLGLAGETTLSEAELKAGFQVRLPAYPANLGAPDAVFYQELGGPVVVLVWLDAQQRDKARLSLHILGEGAFAHKGNPALVLTTTVEGHEAAWTQGPYMLAYQRQPGQEFDMRRLVEGNVLVWFEDGLTYRLESDLPLEEAVRVAESLE
jgi:hypothetical protein